VRPEGAVLRLAELRRRRGVGGRAPAHAAGGERHERTQRRRQLCTLDLPHLLGEVPRRRGGGPGSPPPCRNPAQRQCTPQGSAKMTRLLLGISSGPSPTRSRNRLSACECTRRWSTSESDSRRQAKAHQLIVFDTSSSGPLYDATSLTRSTAAVRKPAARSASRSRGASASSSRVARRSASSGEGGASSSSTSSSSR